MTLVKFPIKIDFSQVEKENTSLLLLTPSK